MKLIRELFKDEYQEAITPAAKSALANEILTVAKKTNNDPPVRSCSDDEEFYPSIG